LTNVRAPRCCDARSSLSIGAGSSRRSAPPEAAAAAGRPKPRVVVGLPVAVTRETAGARTSAARVFQIYGFLPSYRAMLDREKAEGPADVAIVGDESAVGAALQGLAEAGATDYLAVPFAVDGDGEAIERTRAFLVRLAARV